MNSTSTSLGVDMRTGHTRSREEASLQLLPWTQRGRHPLQSFYATSVSSRHALLR